MNYEYFYYIFAIIAFINIMIHIGMWMCKRKAANGCEKEDIVLAQVAKTLEDNSIKVKELEYELLNREYGEGNSVAKLSKKIQMHNKIVKSIFKIKELESAEMKNIKQIENLTNYLDKQIEQRSRRLVYLARELKFEEAELIFYTREDIRKQEQIDKLKQQYSDNEASIESLLNEIKLLEEEKSSEKNQQDEQLFNDEIKEMEKEVAFCKQKIENNLQKLNQLRLNNQMIINQRLELDEIDRQLAKDDQEIKELNDYIVSFQQAIDKEKKELDIIHKLEISKLVQAIKQHQQKHQLLEQEIIELTNKSIIKPMKVDEINQHHQTQQQEPMETTELPDQVNFEIMESVELPIQISAELMEADELPIQLNIGSMEIDEEQEPME